jgi:SAM-dependent methyltransferase
MNKNKLFEESYFEGHYKNNTGSFTQHDLQKAMNWYWGWLRKINGEVNMKDGKGKAFLEVGCGIAPVANILCKRGFQCYASDVSTYATNKARKLNPDIIFIQQDITKKVTFNKKFDLIIAFEVIEHLTNPGLGLKNMFSLLRNDGVLICSTPFPCKKAYNDPTHISVYDKDYWEMLFKKTGFKNITCFYVSFLPFFYRWSKLFSIALPVKITWQYVNSTIIIIAKN